MIATTIKAINGNENCRRVQWESKTTINWLVIVAGLLGCKESALTLHNALVESRGTQQSA
jgi:hypothetical protein